MALVLIDGFDHYSSASEKFWNGEYLLVAPGRDGRGQCISVSNVFAPVWRSLPSSYGTVVLGVAVKMSNLNSGGDPFLQLMAGSSVVAELALDDSQRLTLKDAAGRILTGSSIVPINSWFFVEVKIVVGPSSVGEVRLNGNPTPEITTSTGNFGSSDISRVQLYRTFVVGGSHINYFDDLYILDGSGAAPQNDFLGDVAVLTFYPSADGTHTDWTPNSGTDHFSRVNEPVIDGDSSYVSDSTVGDEDSYRISSIFAGTVYAAQLNLGARKGDLGTRQIAPLVRQAGLDHVGPTETLSTDYLFYGWLMDNDPTGSPWTPSTLAADEYGVKTIT